MQNLMICLIRIIIRKLFSFPIPTHMSILMYRHMFHILFHPTFAYNSNSHNDTCFHYINP